MSTSPKPTRIFMSDIVEIRKKDKYETIHHYIKYFETVASINYWSDYDKLHILKSRFLPDTPEYNAVRAKSTDTDETLEELISCLKESNQPFRDINVIKLNSLEQTPGLSLNELARRISYYIGELYPEIPHDSKNQMNRDRFYAALKPKLRIELLNRRDLKTMPELLAVAELIESFESKKIL